MEQNVQNAPETTQSVNNKESVIKKPRSEKQKEWARQLGQNSKRMKEAKKAKQMEQLQSQTETMHESSTHIQSVTYKTTKQKVFPTLLIFSIAGGIIYYLYKKKTSTKQTQEINKAKVHKASHDQGLKQPPVAQLCSKQPPVTSLVFMQ